MINEAISSILQQEAEAVRNIPITDGYEESVTLIVKHVHELGGNLITSGMGKAGQIAMNIATTFCSTGTPAYFLHPSEAQHGAPVGRQIVASAASGLSGLPVITINK